MSEKPTGPNQVTVEMIGDLIEKLSDNLSRMEGEKCECLGEGYSANRTTDANFREWHIANLEHLTDVQRECWYHYFDLRKEFLELLENLKELPPLREW